MATDAVVAAYPALPAFAAALVALFVKTTLTSMLQVVSRFRSRAFTVAEDAALLRVPPQPQESPFVQRCASVWRNDVENLPLFLALALTYVLLGAPPAAAQPLFFAYVALRYAHTAVYLLGLQPWRALMYLLGMAVCWVIAARILLLLAQPGA
ncbi:MAG TPA: MAPEG family protein [Noviherbaspirillum sp.]|uniref:MAPEG family protein n=1 Tax=Noviherbaspirillum sp. TaxID=1926288 RepID=UPI002D74935D|nr:MAPEG family protein [Noviherbaspirillum sp.]HYD94134.1 MAPEG family protein [Noviherbaspirillum sp.]